MFVKFCQVLARFLPGSYEVARLMLIEQQFSLANFAKERIQVSTRKEKKHKII
jgi:hypothetical protein